MKKLYNCLPRLDFPNVIGPNCDCETSHFVSLKTFVHHFTAASYTTHAYREKVCVQELFWRFYVIS